MFFLLCFFSPLQPLYMTVASLIKREVSELISLILIAQMMTLYLFNSVQI